MNLNQLEIAYKSPRISRDDPHIRSDTSIPAGCVPDQEHVQSTNTLTVLHYSYISFFFHSLFFCCQQDAGRPGHSLSLSLSLSFSLSHAPSLSPSLLLFCVSPPLRYSRPHLGQFNELMPVNYSLRCGWPTKLCSSLSLSLSLSPSPLINGGERTRGREKRSNQHLLPSSTLLVSGCIKAGREKKAGWSARVCVCVCVCVPRQKTVRPLIE